MGKTMMMVGVSAGIGGLVLGKWGAPIEAKLVSWKAPAAIAHFGLVAASAMVVFGVANMVL